MNISQFFRTVLRAPLRNTRWSWGAVNEDHRTVYLRVWKDEVEPIDGQDAVQIWWTDATDLSLGGNERKAQVELIQAGYAGYGVLCTATNTTVPPRVIAHFDDETLYPFGRLFVRGNKLYASIGESVPVDPVVKRMSPRRLAEIANQVTGSDLKHALEKLRTGFPHRFGGSV